MAQAAAQNDLDRELSAFAEGLRDGLLGSGPLVAEVEEGRERVFAQRVLGLRGAGGGARRQFLFEGRAGGTGRGRYSTGRGASAYGQRSVGRGGVARTHPAAALTGHGPFANQHEFAVAFTWGILLVNLFFGLRYRIRMLSLRFRVRSRRCRPMA